MAIDPISLAVGSFVLGKLADKAIGAAADDSAKAIAQGRAGWAEQRRFQKVLEETWATFERDPQVNPQLAHSLRTILWDKSDTAQRFRAEAVKILWSADEPDVSALARLYKEKLHWAADIWGQVEAPEWDDLEAPLKRFFEALRNRLLVDKKLGKAMADQCKLDWLWETADSLEAVQDFWKRATTEDGALRVIIQSVEDDSESDVSNFPDMPSIEIPRDSLVRFVAQRFSKDCPVQVVTGVRETGKTNFLSQFARQYSDFTISYFITSSPLTQGQFTFLYSLCKQMSRLLGKQPPTRQLELEGLKSLCTELFNSLHERAKARGISYYLLVDGLEWGQEGREDTRIVDLFPLSPHGPYLLFSCRLDKMRALPDYFQCQSIDSSQLAFHKNDTREYFSDIEDLSVNVVDKIHQKYNGVPGYIKIVKDAIQRNPDFELDSAPSDLSALIRQQVEFIFESFDQVIVEALGLLAASPVPLLLSALVELTASEANGLVNTLMRTGLVRYNSENARLEYVNELTRQTARELLGEKLKEISERLFAYARTEARQEETLLDLLLVELDDYVGLQSRLTVPAVIESLNNSSAGISSVIKRLQTAAEMAQRHGDTVGLLKWGLATCAAKAFVSHAVNQDEINALIAVGESQEALRRVYKLPEMTSKIRLLARTYASMKARGDKVPSDAERSLKTMAESLRVEELDKEIAQQIVVDLLPVLPDVAMTLLERVLGQNEKQGLMERTMEVVSATLQEPVEESVLSIIEDKIGPGHFGRLIDHVTSERFADLPFSELLEELDSNAQKTKSKEYLIRQWCKRNSGHKDIVQAIYAWQETVIGDRDFVVPLRSLRQVSELIIELPLSDRRGLIEALRVPALISIDSPKEEWIRFRLNLVEALFEIDRETSQSEFEELHKEVARTATELDTKAFCLARLLLTVKRVMPFNQTLEDRLEREFQEAFDLLRRDSARQFQLTRGVIRTLVDIQPDDAFIVALSLNTQTRRSSAVQLVLRATLSTWGETDVANLVKDALDHLGQYDYIVRDYMLVEVIRELKVRECVLAYANLDMLLTYSREIRDASLRSDALGNLAVLYKEVSLSVATKMVAQAIEAWRGETDVAVKLSWGYELVECVAKVDLDRAKEFCREVQNLHFSPESTLASGSLGASYKEVLELAMRAIDIRTFGNSDQALHALELLVERIPSEMMRTRIYAQLAASAYRSGYSPYADNVVRAKVIPKIKSMPPGFDRDMTLEFSFPVIFQYDPSGMCQAL